MAEDLTLKEVLNVDWLKLSSVSLRVEESGSIPLRTFFVGMILEQQLPKYDKADKVKFLCLVLNNVERRTIYTWQTHKMNPTKCYPKRYKTHKEGLPETANEKFKIEILRRGDDQEQVLEYTTCIQELENLISDKSEYKKSKKGPKEKKETKQGFEYLKPLTPKVKPQPEIKGENIAQPITEDTILSICENFSTGLLTITEACERNHTNYLLFVDAVMKSKHYNNIYKNASKYAMMLQNSRQTTLVDTKIIQLLENGHHVTETITYEKVIIPGQIEPKWIEKEKKITRQQLRPNELISLKTLLMNSTIITPNEQGNEFSTMTEAELVDYITKNSGSIQINTKQETEK